MHGQRDTNELAEIYMCTVIEIDMIGTFQVSKVVYDKSMKKNGGNIINISA